MPDPMIRPLPSNEAARRLDELAALLVDAVESGASVNFMRGLTLEEAAGFWRGQLPGLADGSRVLIVAEEAARLLGTVVLTFAPQPNQPHRAEISKMIVLRQARGRGLGRALLAAAERAAQSAGRTLLLLDTEAGSAGEALYRRCGWRYWGSVPGYALTPDGRPAAAAFFYKELVP